jgi:hypothetical protein
MKRNAETILRESNVASSIPERRRTTHYSMPTALHIPHHTRSNTVKILSTLIAAVSMFAATSAFAGPPVTVTFKNIGTATANYTIISSNEASTYVNASPKPAATVAAAGTNVYSVTSLISPDVNLRQRAAARRQQDPAVEQDRNAQRRRDLHRHHHLNQCRHLCLDGQFHDEVISVDDASLHGGASFRPKPASIDDEELGAAPGGRAMRLRAIGNLIAHTCSQREHTPIGQLGAQFAFKTQQHVSLLAPVIGEITRRVFDHPHANLAETLRAPIGDAGVARVFGAFDRRPVGDAEGDVGDLH